MDWYSKFVVPVWKQYKIWPFAALVVLLLIAAYIFGVDLGAYFNRLLGL